MRLTQCWGWAPAKITLVKTLKSYKKKPLNLWGAAWQAASPGAAPGEQASSYLPLRIAPAGLQPLLIMSFFFSQLPSGVALISPAAAGALTASVMSPAAMPWSFAAFVLVSELGLMFANSRVQAHELADWMNAVRTVGIQVKP